MSKATTAGWNVVGGGVVGAGKPVAKKAPAVKPDILAALKAFQVRFPENDMISVRDFRATVAMGKAEFDAEMIRLSDAGQISLYHHDFPFGVSSAERESFVCVARGETQGQRGTWFIGCRAR